MENLRRPDPNEDRNDPMIPEYWELGEQIQERIRGAGYETDVVESLAVDIHDILQAADAVRDVIGPALLSADGVELTAAIRALVDELGHIRWHCDSAVEFLEAMAAASRSDEGYG
jgi:hypothetical protein